MNSAHEGQQLYKIAKYICASSSQDLTCMHCYLVLCTSSLARTLLPCTQCHHVGENRTPHRQLTGYKGQGPHTSELSIFLHGLVSDIPAGDGKIGNLFYSVIEVFSTDASLYSVCITQQFCHIMILFQNCSVIKKKYINLMLIVIFRTILILSYSKR